MDTSIDYACDKYLYCTNCIGLYILLGADIWSVIQLPEVGGRVPPPPLCKLLPN